MDLSISIPHVLEEQHRKERQTRPRASSSKHMHLNFSVKSRLNGFFLKEPH